MTKRIFTDTEYWELKDECQGILASAEQESDPKAKKRLIKSVDEIRKIMHDYETRKLNQSRQKGILQYLCSRICGSRLCFINGKGKKQTFRQKGIVN